MLFANMMLRFNKNNLTKTGYTALVFFCLVLSFSCNKKNTPKEEEPITEDPNHRSKFIDTLATTYSSMPLAVANSRDNNLFYVVQKQSNGNYLLLKCNDNGELIYSKSINLGSDQLIEIEGAENTDDFFTLNSTYNFSQTGTTINAYQYNGFANDSTRTCDSINYSDFSFNSAFITANETAGSNYSTLRKFSNNGVELWNKQLDGNYFSKNAIETDEAGNVYVLTANRSGKLPVLSTLTSTVAPYYTFKLDSNYFSLYKFDANGTQLFKKTITNVFEALPGQFEPSLALSKYNVCVSNRNNLFFFDLNGNLVSSLKPIKNKCYNYILASVGNIRLSNMIVHGSLNYKNGISNSLYFEAFNPGGFSLVGYTSYNSPLTKMARSGELFYAAGTTVRKLDMLGALIYEKNYTGLGLNFDLKNTLTDKFSSLYSFTVSQNKIIVYKFGANGNYN